MHTDKIGNATDEQYSGFEPCRKGSEWVIDAEGTRKVSDSWRCYFGGGETLDIDGDGVQDTLVKGEINVKGTCFFMFGLHSPQLIVTNPMQGVRFDSAIHSGKVFDENFKKLLSEEPFQNPFGKLFIKRIGDCLDYKFNYQPEDGTGSRRPC